MKVSPKSLSIGAGIAVAAFVAVFVVSQMMIPGPSQLEMEEEANPQRAALMSALLDNGHPPLGSADAPITLVEFGDYQCHFCNVFFHDTEEDIIRNYVDTGLVRMVFKDRTIIGPRLGGSGGVAGGAPRTRTSSGSTTTPSTRTGGRREQRMGIPGQPARVRRGGGPGRPAVVFVHGRIHPFREGGRQQRRRQKPRCRRNPGLSL